MTRSNRDSNQNIPSHVSENFDNGTTKQKLEEDAHYAKQEVGEEARKKAEAGQQHAAEEANTLSEAIDAAAANLDDNDRHGLASYAREMSGLLTKAASQIEDRSIEELAHDAKRLARNNPSMFMLGSVAVGFGLSRFFKASAEHQHHDDSDASHRYETQQNNDVSTGTPGQEREENLGMTTTDLNKNEGRKTV